MSERSSVPAREAMVVAFVLRDGAIVVGTDPTYDAFRDAYFVMDGPVGRWLRCYEILSMEYRSEAHRG